MKTCAFVFVSLFLSLSVPATANVTTTACHSDACYEYTGDELEELLVSGEYGGLSDSRCLTRGLKKLRSDEISAVTADEYYETLNTVFTVHYGRFVRDEYDEEIFQLLGQTSFKCKLDRTYLEESQEPVQEEAPVVAAPEKKRDKKAEIDNEDEIDSDDRRDRKSNGNSAKYLKRKMGGMSNERLNRRYNSMGDAQRAKFKRGLTPAQRKRLKRR